MTGLAEAASQQNYPAVACRQTTQCRQPVGQ
jgi:hypothetical protein